MIEKTELKINEHYWLEDEDNESGECVIVFDIKDGSVHYLCNEKIDPNALFRKTEHPFNKESHMNTEDFCSRADIILMGTIQKETDSKIKSLENRIIALETKVNTLMRRSFQQ